MSVDVSKECDFINQAIKGGEVRKSLSGGIQKIADEVNKYEDAQNQEQTDFENAQKREQSNYETKIDVEFDNYKSDLIKQENDFEDAQEKEQSDYEAKMDDKWSGYKKTMDSDEVIREQNEDARQSSEQKREADETTRQSNETTRKQNEIVRQDNEATRIQNETAREIAFAGMQHVDANLELSAARGTFDNLNDRLNYSEGETLVNKELITIPHNTNSYPNVRCICTSYGAGVGGAGEGPAGGTESYLVNAKIGYPDTNNVKIYVPANYLIRSPVLQQINNRKYILASSDKTETKSMLINLMEVA
ncbi:hypothetical protein [Clostridium coskatii]|uniref:Baseplate upper protein immunoglobulin like domain-containing protein n=1 Tax=Clostridium coskatii TaxID=1705578 RepID=A0A166TTP9_9CLOT|nr:hypothetical protein [Clostridium coskatii]OAA94078.1 hypothetical protein WX73_03648 [Clostridium coskatii]OBR96640.1 hypothetical protein CLCOS_08020 [Clostridium coskatii]